MIVETPAGASTPPRTTTPLLEVSALSLSYGAHDVLTTIDLRLDAGELVGLLGPNGAGKSTLIKAVVGLVRPRTGIITIDTVDVSTLGARERARQIAYVPQHTDAPFPLTVFDQVLLGRTPHIAVRPRPSDRDAVLDVLTALGMEELAMRPVTELSGGQRQKVGIAQALAQSARVLLLDEPTSALDLHHQIDALQQVRATLAHTGAGSVMSIHDPNLAARFCDRLVLVADGRVVASGIPSDVLSTEVIGTAFRVDAEVDRSRSHPVVVPRGLVASDPVGSTR